MLCDHVNPLVSLVFSCSFSLSPSACLSCLPFCLPILLDPRPSSFPDVPFPHFFLFSISFLFHSLWERFQNKALPPSSSSAPPDWWFRIQCVFRYVCNFEFYRKDLFGSVKGGSGGGEEGGGDKVASSAPAAVTSPSSSSSGRAGGIAGGIGPSSSLSDSSSSSPSSSFSLAPGASSSSTSSWTQPSSSSPPPASSSSPSGSGSGASVRPGGADVFLSDSEVEKFVMRKQIGFWADPFHFFEKRKGDHKDHAALLVWLCLPLSFLPLPPLSVSFTVSLFCVCVLAFFSLSLSLDWQILPSRCFSSTVSFLPIGQVEDSQRPSTRLVKPQTKPYNAVFRLQSGEGWWWCCRSWTRLIGRF